MPTISDYLQQSINGVLSISIGLWVQLTNNATGATYVSTAASDANGLYTVNNVPAGIYTVKTGPTNTGAWTATGDTNYTVDPIDSGGSVVPAGLTGAVAATRYVGATTYGKPTTGTFAVGDFAISQASGTVWVCSVAGTPGTWVSGEAVSNVLDYGASTGASAAANATAIHAARDAAGVGGTVMFPGLGTYNINALTANVANQHWIIQTGATLFLANGQNAVALTASANGVVVDGGGVIDGNKANQSAGHGLSLSGDNCTADGLTVQNGYFASIGCFGNRPKVKFCTILDGGSVVLWMVTAAADLQSPLFQGNTIRITAGASAAQGVVVHGSSAGAFKVIRPRIVDNELIMPSASTAGVGIEIWNATRKAVVRGNTVFGSNFAISLDHSDGVSCTGNTIESPWNYGIELATTNHATVSGNTIDCGSQAGFGIIADGTSSYLGITGNTVLNSAGKGIYTLGSDHVTVTGNTIQHGATQTPIYFQNSTRVTCVGNTINASSADAIMIDSNAQPGATVIAHNNIEGVTNAVALSGITASDRMIIGPNIGHTAMTDLILRAGTLGPLSRVIRGTVAPVGLATITVTASPFTYTNADPTVELVYILAGTVSAITKNGVSIATATSATMPVPVWLEPNEAVVVTYTVAPTMTKDRK